MPQAHADPDEMLRFAEGLATFRSETEAGLGKLRQEFATLSETWRDQQQASFESSFNELHAALERFVHATEEYGPYLRGKAAQLHEYLGR